MRIMRSVIQVTVLHPESEAPDVAQRDLDYLHHEMSDGGWLGGKPKIVSQEIVPTGELAEACRQVGNDGHFFDDHLVMAAE